MRLSERRTLLRLVPAALAGGLLRAQTPYPVLPNMAPDGLDSIPDPKRRQNAIVKEDYAQNIKDARELVDLAKSFEEGLERDDKYVVSLNSLKKLDEIEKLTKRIRGRMKRA